jgi:beta-lactam-binding protein with PASTA domain
MKFLRFITRSLILLLIALFSAVTAMRFAIHGREVRVPNLLGMTVLQAREAANANGLTVSIDDKFYSSDIGAGKIMSQAPPASSKVRRGWRIRVAESLGPQRVTIPELVGDSERAASINVRDRGLDLATVASIPLPGISADQVIAQFPPANAADVTTPKVSVLLAKPAAPADYVMPDFVGRSVAEARGRAAHAGLQTPIVTAAPGTSPQAAPLSSSPASAPVSGKIVAQSPPPGSRVNPDTVIRFEVAQ